MWIRWWIVGLIVLTAVRPDDALLSLAGLLPIASVTAGATRAPVSLLELSVVASFLGWTARYGLLGTKGALRGLAGPLTCVALVIVSSAGVDVLGRREVLGDAEFRHYFGYVVPRTYFSDHDPREILHHTGALLSGLALFIMAAVTIARRPELTRPAARMAAAGATAAAVLSVLRLFFVALAAEHPVSRLLAVLGTIRISVQFGDVNAAGSQFAMMFFVAVGLGASASRWSKAGWWVAAGTIAVAAWLTSSRAAAIAIILVSVGITLRSRKAAPSGTLRRRLAPLAACLVAAGLFVVAFPNRLIGIGTSVALQVRLGMAAISLSMLRGHPWFGIGVGRYYETSAPLLAASPLGTYYFRENAHNNVLQIVAELGLVGAAAVGWLLWRVAGRLRSAVSRNAEPVYYWLAAGLIAFLLTALVGHPLLTPEVALSFWLLLGIAAGSSPGREAPGWKAAGCLGLLLLVTFPVRVRHEIRDLDREHVTYGFSSTHQDERGETYRTIARRATFFLRRDASAVRIPMRVASPDGGTRQIGVVAMELDGREVARVTVGDVWTIATLPILKPPPDGNFHKVVLMPVPGASAPVEIRVGALRITYRPPQ